MNTFGAVTNEHPAAYFCAEYGVHNSLPNYSGGLGILAETKGKVFVQRPADYAPRDRYDAVRAQGLELADLRQEAILEWISQQTNAGT